ncbi:dihydrodipicolinate reductase [Dongia mobilis]|uniref:4-hydroxy-tetrahydrodipicolinate reductase n=1 Tax=Dongia mobilis TaxID=578943 RepID=A0A4R6WRE9_9PROT|nr:dihydrodipicolinate reductase [Dongia mobilis]
MAGKAQAKRPKPKAAPAPAAKSNAKTKPLPKKEKASAKPARDSRAAVPQSAKPAAAKPAAAKPVTAKPVTAKPGGGGLRPKRPVNGAIRVGIAGCAGRMGQMLLKTLAAVPGVLVVGGSERKGSPALGMDLGALAGTEPFGITVGDDASALFEAADVVIDFTNPAATAQHAGFAARTGTAHVIGTTGLDADQLAAIGRAAQKAPIVMASNMSLGVNLLEQVVEQIARILDPDWDIEIVEMHHRHKVDAPSGTALTLGEAAARGRGVPLRRVARRARDGHVGARVKGEIGFQALRGGDVVGDHTVMFAADGERVEITHKASSREIFARGAVKAVLWAAGKGPGLYSMKDVLGFSVGGSAT